MHRCADQTTNYSHRDQLSVIGCLIEERYFVEQFLASGSYANLYLARDLLSPINTPRHIVIKVLNVALQGPQKAELVETLRANFLAEALLIERLRHPHIIQSFGHGTATDLSGKPIYYILLQYVAGGDLTNLSPLPTTFIKALDILEQVGAALRHIHKFGYIHRDIKPKNILLTENQEMALVADFGIARMISGQTLITSAYNKIYSPPRQHLQFSHPPIIDTYAVSKVLYFLVVGKSPSSFAQRKITSLPYPCRDEAWAPALLQVLKRATSDIPGECYKHVDDLVGDVRDIAEQTLVKENRRGASRRYTKSDSQIVIEIPEVVRPAIPPESPNAEKPRPSVKESILATLSYLRDAVQHLGETIADQIKTINVSSKSMLILCACLLLILVLEISGHLIFRPTPESTRTDTTAEEKRLLKVGEVVVATTDINLRAKPGARSQKIGLVEKASRVRILRIQGNWIEVEVVERGREQEDSSSANKGWINSSLTRHE